MQGQASGTGLQGFSVLGALDVGFGGVGFGAASLAASVVYSRGVDLSGGGGETKDRFESAGELKASSLALM